MTTMKYNIIMYSFMIKYLSLVKNLDNVIIHRFCHTSINVNN